MSDAQAKWLAPLREPARNYLAALMDYEPAPVSEGAPQVVVTPAHIPAPPLAPPDLLREAVWGKIGLVSVTLPGRAHPVWLRAGTDDAAACLKSLAVLPVLPYTPRRILEIGAGAGYRSIALASLFPGAEILSLEPDPALQRVHLLNTLPYGSITLAGVAASTDNARYSYSGRAGGAGRVVLVRDEQGPITAVPLVHFIAGRNFTGYDTVFIKPDAASDHLLRTNWPASVRFIMVDTGGEKLHQATGVCYPEKKYASVIIGDYVVIARREQPPDALPLRPLPVVPMDGAPSKLVVANAPGEAYFAIGGNGFRLHANRPGGAPAQLTVTLDAAGYTQLQVTLRAGHAESLPLRFTVTVADAAAGTVWGTAEEELEGGETKRISVPLEGAAGACKVMFESAMAYESVPNYCAWAEFLEPVLV
jgi:hypothetical protein